MKLIETKMGGLEHLPFLSHADRRKGTDLKECIQEVLDVPDFNHHAILYPNNVVRDDRHWPSGGGVAQERPLMGATEEIVAAPPEKTSGCSGKFLP